MRKFVRAMCHPGAQSAIGSIMVLLLTIALVACGDDSGTSPSDVIPDSVPGSPSSFSVKKLSSSSVTLSSSSVIQSGDSREGSSNSKQSSSSSSKVSSSSKRSDGSSSSKQSSSSVIPASSGNLPSSSSKKVESSSSQKIVSSSSVAPASSSSKKVESSNSEYVPFDHSRCLGDSWNFSDDFYKKFTDTRNGRSYYYYTAVSSKTGKTVTVMAENLNVGEMVLGENDQNDDDKIERYCYNNDTTKCDINGGLYQWAEMMQLPSRCNTESCSDLIQENHRGICPEGWRLLTWDDYVIIRQYDDEFDHGIEGLRSKCFNGYNTSGFSLVSAGKRVRNGKFERLIESVYFFTPEEHDENINIYAHMITVAGDVNAPPVKNDGDRKLFGFSVRCVKLE